MTLNCLVFSPSSHVKDTVFSHNELEKIGVEHMVEFSFLSLSLR